MSDHKPPRPLANAGDVLFWKTMVRQQFVEAGANLPCRRIPLKLPPEAV